MMRMACDSTYILDQKTRYDTKVAETVNILQSIFDNGDEKVVIFSQWERMTRLIAYELDKMGVGYEYLHGDVPSAKRRDLIVNFTDDPDSRVFLSTDAGSTGLNLQAGSIMINLDLPWNPAVLEQRIARIYRLGQERNVQVINLVAKDTIEEQMLDKLRFKTAMFEGVLDNGEDTIFLGNESKFTAMMDTLSDVIEEEAKEQTVMEQQHEEAEADAPEPLKDEPTPQALNEMQETQQSEIATKGVSMSGQMPREPQELVVQGISFLSGLAQTLQSQEATEKLVDSIVEIDKETGQSHLRIPVPDKETVQTLLSLVGKLLAK
jgi:superfamily II DNA/RNA helicase